MGAYLQRDSARIASTGNSSSPFSHGWQSDQAASRHALRGATDAGDRSCAHGNPRFPMLDEPSLGIAPKLISNIFEKIVEINRQHGLTILLVRANANLAWRSRTAYVWKPGASRSTERPMTCAPSKAPRAIWEATACGPCPPA